MLPYDSPRLGRKVSQRSARLYHIEFLEELDISHGCRKLRGAAEQGGNKGSATDNRRHHGQEEAT